MYFAALNKALFSHLLPFVESLLVVVQMMASPLKYSCIQSHP